MIKFLIIEDDEPARVLIKTILKKSLACTVIEAENGELALNILKTETPSIIILDISMPVMDGKEFLGLLRSNPLHRNIPVIIISSFSDKETAGTLMEKGICDYIVKPIDKSETLKRVNKVIAKLLGKNPSSVISLRKDNIGAPRLLLVESDHKSRDLFHKLVGDKFIIHDVKNGIETLSTFAKFAPRFIVVSDKIGLLDKRIITQKIREIATNEEVSIFLIITDSKAVSLKVFSFDGIIKRTDNNEHYQKEITKLLLGEENKNAASEKEPQVQNDQQIVEKLNEH